jgi:DNA-damage-inducible protein D
MTTGLEKTPQYQNTIERLEAIKRTSTLGQEYWMARDIHTILGYLTWDKFLPVIERAASSLEANGIEAPHHIAKTSKMMGLGNSAQREGLDFFLSRPACRLIAMNGDPSKPEIAAAQAYFVVQTHRMEEVDALTADERRLELRERVSTAFRAVSGVAKDAGVRNDRQALFHDARWQGLYGMSAKEVKTKKGLKPNDNLFDLAGPLELSANEFQMNMAADVIKKEGVHGEYTAISKNKKIAQDVRGLMQKSGVTTPEKLPLEEPIKNVKKRLEKQKKLSKP